MRRSLVAVALLVTLTGAALAEPLEEARAAIESDDYTTALAIWRRLADQGSAEAQSALGFMFSNGYGVPLDYAEAANWFRRSAEQSDALGQGGLGFLHERGLGVPLDIVLAHVWYSLAGARSDGALLDLFVMNQARVAARMTPAQIAEAQRLAREWDAAHPAPRSP